MKYKRACWVFGFFVITILSWLIPLRIAHGAFLYKSYIVRYDRGWDILCDPYVVKKNDWVLKLFKQKGEIAHKDFSEFLRIFKEINPHVRDINRIRPGQHILIPLKKLSQESLPEQSSGVVTIPFVTISNKRETLKSQSTKYQVQSGDCVSILVARRYGAYGTRSFQEGLKLFRLNNPRINDLDRIYVGQMIFIPELDVRHQVGEPTVYNDSDKNSKKADLENIIQADEKMPDSSGSEHKEDKPKLPLLEVASALDAKLFEKGDYYFPRSGEEDFRLDLAKFPIMQLGDGKRVFFLKDGSNDALVLDAIKSFWKDVKVVRIAPNDPVEQIFEAVFDPNGKEVISNRLSFSDNGVEVEVRGKWIFDALSDKGKTVRHICITFIDNSGERTPRSISRYLDQNNIVIKEVLKSKRVEKQNSIRPQHHRTTQDVITIDSSDRKAFVNDFIAAMGCQYSSNVGISFPYVGIQVKAVSNLITKSDGSTFLIDFGDLYGDALDAINKSGLDIIQVKKEDDFHVVIKNILNTLKLPYSNDPDFLTADRPADYNTTVTIPGFLITMAGESKMLLSLVPLHNGVIQFLTSKGVKVVLVGSQENIT